MNNKLMNFLGVNYHFRLVSVWVLCVHKEAKRNFILSHLVRWYCTYREASTLQRHMINPKFTEIIFENIHKKSLTSCRNPLMCSIHRSTNWIYLQRSLWRKTGLSDQIAYQTNTMINSSIYCNCACVNALPGTQVATH